MTRKFKITFLALLGIIILCTFLTAQSAHAQTASIFMDVGGGSTLTILDNSAQDRDTRLGVVDYSGGLGVFSLNVVVGTTKPYLTGLPELDLFNVEANSSGSGSINVWFSETGFTGVGSPATVYTTVGGTTNDTVEFFSYIDTADTLFGTGTMTANLGPYVDTPGGAPLGFSGSTSSAVALSTPFSMTGMATITHGSAGLTSYDLNVNVVPEPISSTLFIVGAATLGFRRFRNNRKA